MNDKQFHGRLPSLMTDWIMEAYPENVTELLVEGDGESDDSSEEDSDYSSSSDNEYCRHCNVGYMGNYLETNVLFIFSLFLTYLHFMERFLVRRTIHLELHLFMKVRSHTK